MMENIGFPEEFADLNHLDEMYNHVSNYKTQCRRFIFYSPIEKCLHDDLYLVLCVQINVNQSAGFFWNLIESNKFRRFQLNYELEAGPRYSALVRSKDHRITI